MNNLVVCLSIDGADIIGSAWIRYVWVAVERTLERVMR